MRKNKMNKIKLSGGKVLMAFLAIMLLISSTIAVDAASRRRRVSRRPNRIAVETVQTFSSQGAIELLLQDPELIQTFGTNTAVVTLVFNGNNSRALLNESGFARDNFRVIIEEELADQTRNEVANVSLVIPVRKNRFIAEIPVPMITRDKLAGGPDPNKILAAHIITIYDSNDNAVSQHRATLSFRDNDNITNPPAPVKDPVVKNFSNDFPLTAEQRECLFDDFTHRIAFKRTRSLNFRSAKSDDRIRGAIVKNEKSNGDYFYNFVMPTTPEETVIARRNLVNTRGDTRGALITPRGAFDANTRYLPNDLVSVGGSSFVAVEASTGVTPNATLIANGEQTEWMVSATGGSGGGGGGTPGPAGPPGSPGGQGPAGAPGVAGAQGASLVARGVFNPATAYVPLDLVSLNNDSFIAAQASTGVTPNVAAIQAGTQPQWMILAVGAAAAGGAPVGGGSSLSCTGLSNCELIPTAGNLPLSTATTEGVQNACGFTTYTVRTSLNPNIDIAYTFVGGVPTTRSINGGAPVTLNPAPTTQANRDQLDAFNFDIYFEAPTVNNGQACVAKVQNRQVFGAFSNHFLRGVGN